MTKSLEDQLTALCEQHVLTNLTIEVVLCNEGRYYFYSYAQAKLGENHFIGSTGKYDCHLASEAIESAISNLNAKRFPAVVSVLAPMGDVA